MNTALAITEHSSHLPTVGLELVEQAAGYAAESRAPRTRQTYASKWRGFERWCQAHGATPLPASPSTIALFISSEAGRVKVGTIASSLSAIGYFHLMAGIPQDAQPHRHPSVQAIWAGIRRVHGAPPKRVAPLLIGELRQVADVLGDRLIDIRDRALLAIGFAGALRRSELCALTVDDVAFTPEGLKVTIRRSKTDQEGHGAVIGLPMSHDPRVCPVRCLRAWLDAAQITEGPLFRGVNRHGHVAAKPLCGRSIARIVQRSAGKAGLDAKAYSGHSMRAGLATSAAKAGKNALAIQRQGRWASPSMLGTYIRDAQLFSADNAAGGL
jgi:integrase